MITRHAAERGRERLGCDVPTLARLWQQARPLDSEDLRALGWGEPFDGSLYSTTVYHGQRLVFVSDGERLVTVHLYRHRDGTR